MINQSKYARIAAIAIGAAIIFVLGHWFHIRWDIAWPLGAVGYLTVRYIGWTVGDRQKTKQNPDIETSN